MKPDSKTKQKKSSKLDLKRVAEIATEKVEANGDKKKFKATEGLCLPIFYNGSIIFIDDKKAVELDMGLLKYFPKIQLQNALRKKQVIEVEG